MTNRKVCLGAALILVSGLLGCSKPKDDIEESAYENAMENMVSKIVNLPPDVPADVLAQTKEGLSRVWRRVVTATPFLITVGLQEVDHDMSPTGLILFMDYLERDHDTEGIEIHEIWSDGTEISEKYPIFKYPVITTWPNYWEVYKDNFYRPGYAKIVSFREDSGQRKDEAVWQGFAQKAESFWGDVAVDFPAFREDSGQRKDLRGDPAAVQALEQKAASFWEDVKDFPIIYVANPEGAHVKKVEVSLYDAAGNESNRVPLVHRPIEGVRKKFDGG
jgi:hypothetical protein